MTDAPDLFIASIDQFLGKLEKASSDAELRALFDTFEEKYDLDVPSDPFSDEYRAKQFSLYERLAGKAYSPNNEVSAFDVSEMAVKPFPYCHSSSSLVGDQLMAIGFIIKTMALPPGASILEFGPGWGNTTLALAKMGYEVTAVDIEKNFVDLIRQRAEMESLSVNVINGDFSLIETIDKKFDAVLFFECFHHSQDHLKLISNFDRVLAPNGLVCLAAEPINDSFPLPWGLRMDGQSVWAIRKNGWLELGFNIDYFVNALDANGFVCLSHKGYDGPLSSALIAKRRSEFEETRESYRFDYSENSLYTQCGALDEGTLLIGREDSGVASFGPYQALPAGHWEISIRFGSTPHPSGDIRVDVVHKGGTSEIISIGQVRLDGHDIINTSIILDTPVADLEVRIFTEGNSEFTIREISICRGILACK